jgi:hypothetical protein
VPSVSIGAGGAPGTSYHSNYDTVAWYRATVGADYASPAMVTRIALAIAGLVAQSDRPTWRVAPVGEACLRHLEGVIAVTQDPSMRAQLERLRPGFQAIATRGTPSCRRSSIQRAWMAAHGSEVSSPRAIVTTAMRRACGLWSPKRCEIATRRVSRPR